MHAGVGSRAVVANDAALSLTLLSLTAACMQVWVSEQWWLMMPYLSHYTVPHCCMHAGVGSRAVVANDALSLTLLSLTAATLANKEGME